jgi:7-cyano-7-deazaguanine synthase
VPKGPGGNGNSGGIPITYVPARNTIFLAYALGWAEILGAADIFIGANAVDYSGYPDCRPEFIAVFETLARVATKAGVEGTRYRIHAPLLSFSKAQIILRGLELGVDFSITHSCYDPTPEGLACGRCDSCRIRLDGFREADVHDPIQYAG